MPVRSGDGDDVTALHKFALGSDGYPPLLARIKGPPAELYLRGDARALALPCITIVGTRRATDPGRCAAWAAGGTVAGLGACVVSGLAVGCDGEAHGGALAAGGATVAVLAHGLDRPVYPSEHAMLAGDILGGGGALVSEYPDGTPPEPRRFVERDRVQAGLSIATVLVESDERGGSFHALRAARDAGRPVFAILSHDERFLQSGARRAEREFGATVVRSTRELAAALGPLVEVWRAESKEGGR